MHDVLKTQTHKWSVNGAESAGIKGISPVNASFFFT